MSYALRPEARAILPATIKAASVGALLVTGIVVALLVTTWAQLEPSFASAARLAGSALLVFVLAFVAGIIATCLCLMIIGFPLAQVASGKLAGTKGAAIATGGAMAAFVILLLLDPALAGFALFYAIPAAFFYRREVLLEESL